MKKNNQKPKKNAQNNTAWLKMDDKKLFLSRTRVAQFAISVIVLFIDVLIVVGSTIVLAWFIENKDSGIIPEKDANPRETAALLGISNAGSWIMLVLMAAFIFKSISLWRTKNEIAIKKYATDLVILFVIFTVVTFISIATIDMASYQIDTNATKDNSSNNTDSLAIMLSVMIYLTIAFCLNVANLGMESRILHVAKNSKTANVK